ncbi:MAG: hypothetical protein ACYTA5_20710, partial [Planctomycetota bacterium]
MMDGQKINNSIGARLRYRLTAGRRDNAPKAYGLRPTAWPWYARRGNALIMAVAMTTLLAIIGTSFVLMSRLDRQAVKGVAEDHSLDAALEQTISIIKETLANDVVRLDRIGGAPSKIKLLDPTDENPKETLEFSNEPYDYPGDNDKWLASIEPYDNGSAIIWQQTSELFGASSKNTPARIVDPNTPANNGRVADADGDGITDSRWRRLPFTDAAGNSYWVAVRIFDNCGMININTAWDMTRARSDDFNSFGELLTQVNLERFYDRLNNVVPLPAGYATYLPWLINERLLSLKPGTTIPFGTNNFEQKYQDRVLMHIEDPSAWFCIELNPGDPLSKECVNARLFGLDDEMELRNRYCLNSRAISRLEIKTSDNDGSWGDLLSVSDLQIPESFRRLTYVDTPDPNDNPRKEWFERLVPPANATFWPDQRHLLTTYSFDRELRHVYNKTKPAPERQLDAEVGKWRKVNVNEVLSSYFKWYIARNNGNPNAGKLKNPAYTAIKRLALAFEAAGYTFDQGVQFAANLIDYIDYYAELDGNGNVIEENDSLTVIKQGDLGTDQPSKNIYGTERQPFIVEVYVDATITAQGLTFNAAAVELYNPYEDPIHTKDPIGTDHWQLWYNGSPLIALDGDPIPPKNSIVYCTEKGKIPSGTTPFPRTYDHEDNGLVFNSIGELLLVRPAEKGVMTPTYIVLDIVNVDYMKKAMPVPDVFGPHVGSIWRGLKSKNFWLNPLTPVAPWGWARNEFNEFQESTHRLATMDKITDPDNDPLNEPGVSIPVANRVNFYDYVIEDLADNPNWRVGGWYDLGRILRVGNPDTGQIFSKYLRTITEVIYNASSEEIVRINFHSGFSRQLMKRISLLSRTDNDIDNDNRDKDYDNAYGNDDLLECRIPGRFNVNTIPPAVLEALIPKLVGFKTKDEINDFVNELTTELAARQRATPLHTVNSFLARLDSIDAKDEQDKLIGPHYFRFRKWFDYKYGDGDGAQELEIGDEYMRDDFEERDWVFTRMANLLTTRSDTFTAYILVRVQGAGVFSEKRVVALLDRSNVFLPANKDNNNSWIYQDVNTNDIFDAGDLWGEPFTDNDPKNGYFDLDDGDTFDPKTQDLNGNGVYDFPGEPFNDANGNGYRNANEAYNDLNGNGVYDLDDSGDMYRVSNFLELYGPNGINDINHFDRQYV